MTCLLCQYCVNRAGQQAAKRGSQGTYTVRYTRYIQAQLVGSSNTMVKSDQIFYNTYITFSKFLQKFDTLYTLYKMIM